MSGAEISQQLQEQGQPLARIEQLVAEKKRTLLLRGTDSHDNPKGKATREIEQDAETFVVIKGQKGGRLQ